VSSNEELQGGSSSSSSSGVVHAEVPPDPWSGTNQQQAAPVVSSV
jgi:hypothetical protein